MYDSSEDEDLFEDVNMEMFDSSEDFEMEPQEQEENFYSKGGRGGGGGEILPVQGFKLATCTN